MKRVNLHSIISLPDLKDSAREHVSWITVYICYRDFSSRSCILQAKSCIIFEPIVTLEKHMLSSDTAVLF